MRLKLGKIKALKRIERLELAYRNGYEDRLAELINKRIDEYEFLFKSDYWTDMQAYERLKRKEMLR